MRGPDAARWTVAESQLLTPEVQRRAEVSRSEQVRDFYERMPYPAPLTSLDAHRDLYKDTETVAGPSFI